MHDNLATHKILSYEDIIPTLAGESDEQLVDVRTYDDSITAQYEKTDMKPYTDDVILVRDAVAQKLAAVNRELAGQDVRLKVVYGYRHPEVQQKYFEQRKAELRLENPQMSDEELTRLTHNFVAVPGVAGHPTGGAIDLTLIDSMDTELDMGTRIADYSDPERVQTFVAGLTETQASRRKLLHDAMVDQGFAPFYGEWWHFSYGDREWAAFYHKKTALYGAINL